MPYMNCPRCGLSVRLQASWLTLDSCPRCLARRGVSVTMTLSDRRTWPPLTTSSSLSPEAITAKPDGLSS
jgi:hypothetical protein